jgi:hypothetical protein
VVLQAVLKTFGGTDGWNHQERSPIRAGTPAHAGPTCQYRPLRTGINEVEFNLTTVPGQAPGDQNTPEL